MVTKVSFMTPKVCECLTLTSCRPSFCRSDKQQQSFGRLVAFYSFLYRISMHVRLSSPRVLMPPFVVSYSVCTFLLRIVQEYMDRSECKFLSLYIYPAQQQCSFHFPALRSPPLLCIEGDIENCSCFFFWLFWRNKEGLACFDQD